MHHCPLCGTAQTQFYHQDKFREYWQCQCCDLVFVNPDQRLALKAEKAIYDLHLNDPADTGYRRFLSRLADPLLARLPDGSTGLDFGCGPGPTLSLMLAEAGHQVALYDPIYQPDAQVLECQYDFVTCSEAIEHFYYPDKEWQRLLGLVRPGGWLAIMTKLVRDPDAFSRWHYKNDQTHVCFFSRRCFDWLAERDGLLLEWAADDVILLQKPRS